MTPSLLFLAVLTPAAAPLVPTFAGDVASIVFNNCTACHRPGQVGPFPLTSFAEVQKKGKLIGRVVADRLMPPWKPDAGHGEFRDARRLSEAQVKTVAAWVAGGMPEGDAARTPPLPKFPEGWQLGKPDMVLKFNKPFAVKAEGQDQYVQFVFPLNVKKEMYLNGIELRPGNARVVHHAVGFLDGSGTAKRLAKAKGDGQVYESFDIGFAPGGFLPGYAPGMTMRKFDAGAAIPIKPGADVVFQMHYHPTGKAETDSSEIGLYFTDKPPTNHPGVVLLGSDDIDIPADEKKYKVMDEAVLHAAMDVKAIFVHMHMIGKTAHVWADLPGGKKVDLIKISDWDFNWQDTYQYVKPVKLPKGAVIRGEFTWDNTSDHPRNPNSPPKRIKLGENSTDEMVGVIITGDAKNWVDQLAIVGGAVGHYFDIKGKKVGLRVKD